MADKVIGELPGISSLDAGSLFVAEQNGQAVKVSGKQLTDFSNVETAAQVEQAKTSAQEAKTAQAAAESAILKGPVIQNGTWWVYNQTAGAYQDTGIKATGPQGIPGPTSSVNGISPDASGNITLTASDVNASRTYVDTMNGWRVCVIGDAYMVAHRSFSLSGLTVDTTTIPNNISKTGVLYLPVPFPVEYLTPLATCDRRGQYISSVNSVSGDAAVGFSYRIFDQTNPSAIESTVRFALMGDIKNPPVAPAIAYNAAAAEEIVSIAQSYVDARIAGRKFGYGANFFYGSATYPINDDTGAAMMECDTFVGMVLRGVRYDDSPFADTTPGLIVTYGDMMANCKYSTSDWCTTTRGLITGDTPHNVLGRDIKYADDLAWLAWSQKGRVFSDARNAMPGDIAFWKRPQKSNQFDNIGHVAILGDGGCIYEVTSAGNSGGEVIRKVSLEEKGEMPSYFARMY